MSNHEESILKMATKKSNVSFADIQFMRQSLTEWDNEMRAKTRLLQGVLDDLLLVASPDDQEETIAVEDSPKIQRDARAQISTSNAPTTQLDDGGDSAPSHDKRRQHRKNKRHSRRHRRTNKSSTADQSDPSCNDDDGRPSLKRLSHSDSCIIVDSSSSSRGGSTRSAPPLSAESSLRHCSSSSLHSRPSRRATRNPKDNGKDEWKQIMKQLNDLKKSQGDLGKKQKRALKKVQTLASAA